MDPLFGSQTGTLDDLSSQNEFGNWSSTHGEDSSLSQKFQQSEALAAKKREQEEKKRKEEDRKNHNKKSDKRKQTKTKTTKNGARKHVT